MGISNDIRYKYASMSVVGKMIVINTVIFILNILLPFLFSLPQDFFLKWFELPKQFSEFITRPWSIITYAFFHADGIGQGRLYIWHILWNMVLLYFSGRIFLNLFRGRRFLNVYFLGAIMGGVFFVLSYNMFPAFFQVNTSLIGASAAVMAILIFVCTYIPNQETRILFFNVKLWYIGGFFVILDLVQIPFGNAGGHLAHLGGATLGFVYAKKLYEGKDIGEWFEKIMSRMVSFFKPKKKSPLKTVYKKEKVTATTASYSASYTKNEHQQKIDDILDKISKSGYESLSKEEKDYLFNAGKDS
ncbi:rhomboid family intramembrane serine protease [Leptobacterium sp. I13]|uniref:rhomboid family intramembrane serine protease n=1 Tax=Leptobacterium meishanense TaxID=3128904 RepID=UPI0030EF02EF